jgi:hypothetical protein
MAFITAQLLAMPDPVRDVIARASRSSMFAQITAGTIRHDQDTGTWPAAKHTIALLAVIAACYEDGMDGDQGKYTWRTDRRFTQCPHDDAGAYLRFLATAGHELSGRRPHRARRAQGPTGRVGRRRERRPRERSR